MIDGREPNYICLDTRVMKLVRRLPDSDRLTFFDGFQSVYDDKLNGDNQTDYPDNMVGDLLKQAAETMIDGFDSYMRRANANPEGKNGRESKTGHRQVNDIQSNQDQINKDQITQDQINQIKMQLTAEGYTGSEIDSAITRCSGKPVRNLAAYIRQSIENDRREKASRKANSAHNFQERDYSGVDEYYRKKMEEEIMQYRKEHPEEYDENGRLKS